jgi:hypothetical protein
MIITVCQILAFGSMENLDQGHLYPKLEVPGLTCPASEASNLEKSHPNSLHNSYSELLHMSLQHDSPQCMWLHEHT